MNQKQLQTKYAYLLDDASLLPVEEVKEKPLLTEEVNEGVKGFIKDWADKFSKKMLVTYAKKNPSDALLKINKMLESGSLTDNQREWIKDLKVAINNDEVEEFITKATTIKEGFDTHVLCSSCGSGDLQLSKKRTKIRCVKCGNVGLTENIVGLKLNETLSLALSGILDNKLRSKIAKLAKDTTDKKTFVEEARAMLTGNTIEINDEALELIWTQTQLRAKNPMKDGSC